MVYFLDQTHSYEHSWALVNQGIWQKYPNRQCAHVVSVDVLDRTVDPKTGVIRTERVLGVKQKAPAWVLRLLGGSEDAFVREVSFVDPQTQRTTLTSVNLSLSQYLACVENITYTPSSSAPETKTTFYQSVSIKAGSAMWRSLGGNLERWSAQRFFENASKGRQGLEEVLTRLWEEVQHEQHAAVMG